MEKKTLYIDYFANTSWVISDNKDFCSILGSDFLPERLFKEYSKNYNLVLSDAAALIVHHDLMNLPITEQFFRAHEYQRKQEQENQH